MHRIIHIFLFVVANFALLDAQIKPGSIEALKISASDLPAGFELYREAIVKPENEVNAVKYTTYHINREGQKIETIKEEKIKITQPTGTCFSQIWIGDNINSKKEKIEIDMIICISKDELEKTIRYYTREAYAVQIDTTVTPLAGDISWVPAGPNEHTFSCMFLKGNVFVRVYIYMEHAEKSDLLRYSNILVKKIEQRIK